LTKLSSQRSNKRLTQKGSEKQKTKRPGKSRPTKPAETTDSDPLAADPDDVGDVRATPLVRLDFDMPEGTQDAGDSLTETEDLNDPHRRLDIALDGLIDPIPPRPSSSAIGSRRSDRGSKKSTPSKRVESARTNRVCGRGC
uniref:BLVR domain-containing protein n=1 Tax=Echinostoma caproni TaxID=27848 RepID=A0A183A0D9_9TREM